MHWTVWHRLGAAIATLAAVVAVTSAFAPPGATSPPPKESSSRLEDRIARQLAAASPIADAADAKARDAAAERLIACEDFLKAAGEKIVWGGFNAEKGYDPKLNKLTEFVPMVWLKLYASTIMFTGDYEVRKEGQYSVLEMKARFRGNLDPGDYPYPFWHNPKKWSDYNNLASVALVFEGDRLIAGYRKVDASKPKVEKPWDGKWQWTDNEGKAQPRVALFNYMFAEDNPHRVGVEGAYRKLEERFRSENCMKCHAPDNFAKADALVMLNYPNQSLAGRHTIVKVLNENTMPPEDAETKHPAGIPSDATRNELLALAKAFEKEADAALAFEAARKTGSKTQTK